MRLLNFQHGIRLLSLLVLSLSLYSGELLAAGENPVSRTVDIGHAQLNTLIWGDEAGRETIIALPGSGGDNSRYQAIGPLLAAAGYRIIAVNQRGIMGSTGELADLTLHDYADDVIAIADALDIPKVHLLGWALGNRTSRVVATDYPDRVASISLIAAGVSRNHLPSRANSVNYWATRIYRLWKKPGWRVAPCFLQLPTKPWFWTLLLTCNTGMQRAPPRLALIAIPRWSNGGLAETALC